MVLYQIYPAISSVIYEKLEDTKGVIRSRKSKDRQHNSQTKKYNRTNNDLQNITLKTKDRARQTPLITGVNSCALKVHAPHLAPVMLL